MKALLLLPLASFVAAGCARHAESTAAAPAALPPAQVQLATARLQQVPELTDLTGIVRPARRAQLAAKVMGAIAEMPVTLGQSVHAGELLVRLSAGEINARVAQAKSQLNAARRDLERERDLLEKHASTTDLVRGLEDRYAAAEAMVREAETMLGYTEVRAPFDGVIARKLANVGDLAAPGAPLVDVEGASDFQIEAGIPDSLVSRLAPGATLHVEVPASGVTFDGRVAELSSAADAHALTVLAKITVPADVRVRSGEFARVQVPGKPVPAVLVPASSVTRLGQMQRVFVADAGNRAVLRLVKTGVERGEAVEILSGLDDQERVVVAPPAGLREGQPLEVRP